MTLNKYIFESDDSRANILWTVISEFKFKSKKLIIRHQFIEAKSLELNKVLVECEENTYCELIKYINKTQKDKGYYLKSIY